MGRRVEAACVSTGGGGCCSLGGEPGIGKDDTGCTLGVGVPRRRRRRALRPLRRGPRGPVSAVDRGTRPVRERRSGGVLREHVTDRGGQVARLVPDWRAHRGSSADAGVATTSGSFCSVAWSTCSSGPRRRPRCWWCSTTCIGPTGQPAAAPSRGRGRPPDARRGARDVPRFRRRPTAIPCRNCSPRCTGRPGGRSALRGLSDADLLRLLEPRRRARDGRDGCGVA